MKYTTTLFIFLALSITYLSGQDFISIVGTSPYPEGTKVFFTGYEGFSKVDLGGIRAVANGDIDYFVEYHGYCMMSAVGKASWPLILEYDPVCLEWDTIPSFPCDPENEFYYGMRPASLALDSMLSALLQTRDSLEKIKFRENLDQAIGEFRTQLSSGTTLKARTLLESELMIIEAALVQETEDMATKKAVILEFINSNYKVLFHSDLLIRLAKAYLGMNSKVFKNPTSLKQVMIYDVGEWLNILGPLMGEKPVVNFFLIHFIRQGEKETAGALLEKYSDLVKCELYVSSKIRPVSMPYTFSVFGGEDLSRIYNLDQFHGISKILALFAVDCPASIAAVASLYAFMSENQVRMPVIITPYDEPEGEYAELLNKEAPFGMQTGAKTGNAIISGAGIKQLPAFIILDERNLLKEIYYDFEEMKTSLSGD